MMQKTGYLSGFLTMIKFNSENEMIDCLRSKIFVDNHPIDDKNTEKSLQKSVPQEQVLQMFDRIYNEHKKVFEILENNNETGLKN